MKTKWVLTSAIAGLVVLVVITFSKNKTEIQKNKEIVVYSQSGPSRVKVAPPRPKHWSKELITETDGRAHRIKWSGLPIEPFGVIQEDRNPFESLQVSGGNRISVDQALNTAREHYKRIFKSEPQRIRVGRDLVWVYRLSKDREAWGRVAQEFFIDRYRLIVDRENGEILSSRQVAHEINAHHFE